MIMDKKPTLQKQLSPLSVWALAFGCVIGWGSFINPGKKFLFNSGVAGTAIAMVLGALVMVIIAFSYAYMVPKYPKAGGEFTFTKACFGKQAAFVCGWFLIAAYLTNVPMNSTAIGLIVDGIDGNANVLKWGFHYEIANFEVYLGEILLASAILILFGVLNILGVKKAGFVQTVLTVLLVSSVFALFITGLLSPEASLSNTKPFWGFDLAATKKYGYQAEHAVKNSGIAGSILATFAIAPWAFVGFDTIPQASEEFKFSYKKVIFIMVLAIVFGCFVYITNNTIAAAALEKWPDKVAAGEWVLLLAAKELLGPFGVVLIGIAVSCAVLSGIMGFYLASSRLMYSMSKDGYLPAVFGKVDEKRGTPKNALIFCIIISLSGPILGREALGWFVDMSAIGASIGFMFTCLSTCVTIRRYKDGSKKLFVLAIIGAIFSCSFMVLQLVPIPGLEMVRFGKESYIMLGIWIALGLIFYLMQSKKIKTVEPETVENAETAEENA